MNFVQNVVIVKTILLYGEVASLNLILYRFGENVWTYSTHRISWRIECNNIYMIIRFLTFFVLSWSSATVLSWRGEVELLVGFS